MNKTNIGRQISNVGYHGRICLLTFAVENQCRMKHNDVLDIKTVCECNRCLGCETLHPQATLIRLNGKETVVEESVKFEFYAILLIENCVDNCRCCGRRYYDFAHATMVFLTPGEIFCMNRDNTLPDCGLLLAFHPDLLWRTALNRHINDYTFFRYRKEEALHLSQRETERVLRYFNDIGEELHHAIDSHSSILISRLIELLLDYCTPRNCCPVWSGGWTTISLRDAWRAGVSPRLPNVPPRWTSARPISATCSASRRDAP